MKTLGKAASGSQTDQFVTFVRPNWNKVQYSGHKGSSDATYLIAFTETKKLFLDFGARWFGCLEFKQIVGDKCLSLQKVSFSPFFWSSLLSLSGQYQFFVWMTVSVLSDRFDYQPQLDATIIGFTIRHICPFFRVPSQIQSDWGLVLPCLFSTLRS